MMGSLHLKVKRALCSVFGHEFVEPRQVRLTEHGVIYQTYCLRCPFGAIGDWYEMEDLGAWKHYRSLRL
jgi:hypothetical protein